jgi:hypothetical protein
MLPGDQDHAADMGNAVHELGDESGSTSKAKSSDSRRN